jgi:membrane protease YdiL (CAAX protease family)
MNNLQRQIRRRPLVGYFVLAYLVSWLLWAPMLTLYLRDRPETLTLAYLLPAVPGVYGPTIAAIVVTGVTEGRRGIRTLLRSSRPYRAHPAWYAGVLLWYPALYAAALTIYIGVSGDQPTFRPAVLLQAPITFLLALSLGPMGEELGWRGFALPRLHRAHGAVKASLILGTLWLFWHLPATLVPGVALPAVRVTPEVVLHYAMMVLGYTFVFTYAYRRTSGSVWMMILLHGSINATAAIVIPFVWGRPRPEELAGSRWIVAALVWATVIGLVLVSDVFRPRGADGRCDPDCEDR